MTRAAAAASACKRTCSSASCTELVTVIIDTISWPQTRLHGQPLATTPPNLNKLASYYTSKSQQATWLLHVQIPTSQLSTTRTNPNKLASYHTYKSQQ